MISKSFTVLGIILSFGGTIITLWKVITTDDKYAGTVNEIANRKEDFPQEKKYVKWGLVAIGVGAGFQIVGLFL